MNPEKGPNFSIIGKISEGQKKNVERRMTDYLHSEKHYQRLNINQESKIENCEIEKTEEEKEFIRMANVETDRILERFGMEPYDFPERNIHMLPDEKYKQITKSNNHGSAIPLPQAILINADKSGSSRINAALLMFHEILHMKSRLIYHGRTEVGGKYMITKTNPYRHGLEVWSVPDMKNGEGLHSYFYGLDEAVTAHEEKIYLQKLLKDARFANESKELFSNLGPEDKEGSRDTSKVPRDEVFAIDCEKNSFSSIGYREERKILDYICNIIASDMHSTPEEIHDKFLRGQITGRLLPLARMVEASFGKGSFRELGNLGQNRETNPKVLENLEKMREIKRILNGGGEVDFQKEMSASQNDIHLLASNKEKTGLVSRLKKGFKKIFKFMNPKNWFGHWRRK